MLHPVGDLPASVYWRRRALLVGLLLSVVVGGVWLAVSAAGGSGDVDAAPAAASSSLAASDAPALERVLPSLSGVQVPADPPVPVPAGATGAAPSTDPAPTSAPAASPAAPGACTDDMLSLTVAASPAEATVASKPTFELVVTNSSAAACVRALDAQLQEVVLFDSTGARVWGSNDCYPETSSDQRTLAPGEAVRLPLTWSGLTSAPGCTARRVTPTAGQYVLRGRLDTKSSADTPFRLV